MKKFNSYLIVALLLALSVTQAFAHPGGETEPDDGEEHEHTGLLGGFRDPSGPLAALDSLLSGVVSSGPSAKVTKNLVAAGTGLRESAGSTTDVWVLGEYAYTGTFGSPCGGDPEAGVWVWDVHNRNKPSFVTIITSPTGSRSNDVKVAAMNSGDVLVHSNESCGGGSGGFEIYNVNDPANPF